MSSAKYIVGLTGGIGSGKTTIMHMFANLGVDYVDADVVARDVVAPKSNALTDIATYFGQNILLKNGELNRALLRQKIFNNNEHKQWLNHLLHPLIRQKIIQQLALCQSPYCLFVAPLLLENNLTMLVNRVLVVDVDETTQIARTIKRDNNSAELVTNIIASQISRTDRLAAADDVIDNQHLSQEALLDRVSQLHYHYLKLASTN